MSYGLKRMFIISAYKQAFFNKKIRLRRWFLHWLKDFNKIFVKNRNFRSIFSLKTSISQTIFRLRRWLLHWLKDFNKIFVENRNFLSVSRLKMSVFQKKMFAPLGAKNGTILILEIFLKTRKNCLGPPMFLPKF